MHVYEVLLAIALAPSYIPGGARSFWKLIGLLLPVVGFLIALWFGCYCDGLLRRLRRHVADEDTFYKP
jgi:hypothetical protein